MRDDPQVHAETRAEWRAWLVENAATAPGVWLVTWRGGTGRPAPTYEDAVEEALCVGWVDSTAGTVDAERTRLRFSPRRPRSGWSRTNKERIARLEAAGRLTDAGRRVVEAARDDGSWTLLDAVEDLAVPDDLAAALAARPGSREQWEAFPRSARRGILAWIVQAKRPETRRRRIEETAARAAVGERADSRSPREEGR